MNNIRIFLIQNMLPISITLALLHILLNENPVTLVLIVLYTLFNIGIWHKCKKHRTVFYTRYKTENITVALNGGQTKVVTVGLGDYDKASIKSASLIGVKHFSGVTLLIPILDKACMGILLTHYFGQDLKNYPMRYVYTDSRGVLVESDSYVSF